MARYVLSLMLLATAATLACSGASQSGRQTVTSTPSSDPSAATSTASPIAPTVAPTTPSEPTASPSPRSTLSSTATPTASGAADPTATAAVTATAVATASPPPQATTEPGAVVVEIRGFTFPYELHVPAGSTVTWVNRDSVTHDVAARDGSWQSPLLETGESFSRTFPAPGRYTYFCPVHPFMQAALIVDPE